MPGLYILDYMAMVLQKHLVFDGKNANINYGTRLLSLHMMRQNH